MRPSAAPAARKLLAGLLLLQLLLQCCVAIYVPEGESSAPPPPEDDDDEGAGVLTVHVGKKKPPSGSWGAPPPPAPVPPPVGGARRTDCPETSWRGRKRRSPTATKPLPVRERLSTTKREASDFHCPESWKELDFSEVQELECPENATGWFPFPPDCRKYLNCWKGRGFLQACAPATLFHPIRRECDYPKKVKCLPNCRSGNEGNNPGQPVVDGDVFVDGDPTDFVDPDDPDAVSPLLDARSLSGSVPVRRVPPTTSTATMTPSPATSPRGRSRRSGDSRPPRQVFLNARLAGGGGIQCDMEGGTGLAAHPTDCSKFVNCWQGKPHVQSCAGNTYFNPRMNACDFPINVPECIGGKRGSAGSTADAASYTQQQAGQGQGGQGGGYHQFGNQGYQPPPRQTFKPSYGDQVPAASSAQGYGQNQVLPPGGHRGKGLQPYGQGQGSASTWRPSDPNAEVERVGSASVIGPLPQGRPHGAHGGHSESWHRDHGVPMPGGVPPGQNPAYHHQHHHHHHQPGHHPQAGGSDPQGSYTPSPNYYDPNRGGYNPHQPGGYSPQPSGYNPQYGPQSGDNNPQQGGHQVGHNHGHNPQWHRDHGVPMPGQPERGLDPDFPGYGVSTTPAPYPAEPEPTTDCPPEADEDGGNEPLDWDLDLRTRDSSSWINVLQRTRNNSMPQSGQMVRLRGGVTPQEGYVEVMGPGSKWGSVCDKSANWTVEEASVVCRMLGYERGAELAWQGRPRGTPGVLPVHVEEVHCTGNERSLMSCDMGSGDAGDGCNLETQAAGLRCYPNWAAKCRPGEVQYKSSCYSLVVPRKDRRVDAIAFSQDEAIKHCKGQGGHLLDINSQAENDFVSEWLTAAFPALGSVLTSGVGVSVPGRSVWVWEGSGVPVQYSLWWPGPPRKDNNNERAPKVGERPLCILLKKDFPCDSWPGVAGVAGVAGGRGGGRGGGGGYGSWQGAPSCGAEYFFWHAEDCAIRQRAYPYVCERRADDIGCLGPDEYEGPANVSWNGRPCVSWDSPAVVSSLRYRVTEDVRTKHLVGHNHCRRVGTQEPWCFVDAGAYGIREERCDIPTCRENSGNDTDAGRGETTASSATSPPPGLYGADGRPRPPAGDSSPFPSLSRPYYPPVYNPRSRDDPVNDPRGAGAMFPTLPTSRPYAGPAPTTAASWPDPFAGRGSRTTGVPFPTLPTSRTYRRTAQTTPTTPRWTPTGGAPSTEWPLNYAPGFSHREVDPVPPPPPVDLLPPFKDDGPESVTQSAAVEQFYPTERDREDLIPPEVRDDDYFPPDPLTMPLQPRSLGAGFATTQSPVLGFGPRPDPSRGYGLPTGGVRSRPPVVTARPPTELYNAVRPGQSYAPYPGAPGAYPESRPPSYSNMFGILPAVMQGYYPGAEDVTYPNPYADRGSYLDTEDNGRRLSDVYPSGRYPQEPYPTGIYPIIGPNPGSSDPYSQVGYYPRERPQTTRPPRPVRPPSRDRRGSEEGDDEEDDDDERRPADRTRAPTMRPRDASGEDDSGSGERMKKQQGRPRTTPSTNFRRAEEDEDYRYEDPGQQWPPRTNGHSGPGAPPARGPSRQSRTADEVESTTTPEPTPTSTPSPTTATPPAFQTPPFDRPLLAKEAEHVMKIPKAGQQKLEVTSEKIFFM